ncbi:MAG: hypothetical protein PF448_13000 [Bacteroidales bacterium]|jgi:hypothetical protein|nr:hypothetical protein [Bacteroidales bacterium]
MSEKLTKEELEKKVKHHKKKAKYYSKKLKEIEEKKRRIGFKFYD